MLFMLCYNHSITIFSLIVFLAVALIELLLYIFDDPSIAHVADEAKLSKASRYQFYPDCLNLIVNAL